MSEPISDEEAAWQEDHHGIERALETAKAEVVRLEEKLAGHYDEHPRGATTAIAGEPEVES